MYHFKGHFLAIFASICTAFYFLPYKAALKYVDVRTFTFGLFVASFILNILPFIVKRKKLILNRGTIIAAVCFGVLAFLGNNLTGLSMNYVAPAVTSVLLRTQIFMIMIMSFFFLRDKIKLHFLFGAIISVIGIIVVSMDSFKGADIKYLGVLFALLSALSFGTTQIIVKYYIKDIHSLSMNALRLTISLIISSIVTLPSIDISTITPKVWMYCFVSAFFGTTIARIAIIHALKHIQVSEASTFGVLTPLITLVLSYFFLNSMPTNAEIVGGAIILSGVLVALIAEVLIERKDRGNEIQKYRNSKRRRYLPRIWNKHI